MCCLRCLTDNSMPKCMPWLPTNVGIVENTAAPHGGEWVYPASAKRSCCCCAYPGDPQLEQRSKKLILWFHGGAYALCTAGTHREMFMRLVEKTGLPLLAVNYRRPPEHPYPVPVEDCLDAYRWALEHGYDAQDIVFAGDSAGGGLVVATIAAARAAGLPVPAGGMLVSPWMDLTDSFSGTWSSNQEYDYLPRDMAHWFAQAYAGETSLKEASPGEVSLEGFPPLLIMVGERECLKDSVLEFSGKAEQAGLDVTNVVERGMVHVWPMFAAFAQEDSAPLRAYEHMDSFTKKVFHTDTTTFGTVSRV
eukprot:TRINITY_DN7690_c0_g1_i4.p1 TRINITY_DN7690_c0_g1~~TRINITY_DN7690_c0_g1_i4.p1  ORF type:complete len:306 (-),score=63.98 TRINITY_DN7690_c0_g1_i4:165-1082(-)